MFNALEKMIEDKKEYRQTMARVKALPEDYRFVYDKIQKYMWSFTAGDGYDMLKIHYDLVDLFENGAAEGKNVLEITGEDVAAFSDELLASAKTYAGQRRDKLNKEIKEGLGIKE